MWTKICIFIVLKNQIMAAINYIIQSKNNPANIYIRLRDGRKLDIKVKTNFLINPEHWDAEEQKPIKKLLKDIDYANLDTDLQEIKTNLLKEYNRNKGVKNIDPIWVKELINPSKKEEYFTQNLVNYVDVYIKYKSNELNPNTVKKCNVFKQLLSRYQTYCKTPLLIQNVDYKFKHDFETYCFANNYAINTTARAVRFVKTLCKHAKSNGLEVHYQLDSIKIKYVKVDNIYLNSEDITKIESININKLTDSLSNARDWLLISCYCGQRVSDFLRFDKSMIRYEKNKSGVLKALIEFTQVKTQKIMTIPLHPKILEILNKYEGNFPKVISDQKYNDYIKTVCQIAKINEPIHGTLFDKKTKEKVENDYPKWKFVSSHIGRRSFASNNYGIIPTSFLMYITGHSTEAMFLTYIGKSNKDIAMELTNYF